MSIHRYDSETPVKAIKHASWGMAETAATEGIRLRPVEYPVILKRLCAYTDDQLAYLLARVREIAALGDEAALIETDKLVFEIEDSQIELAVPSPVVVNQSEVEAYGNQRAWNVHSRLVHLREQLERKHLGRWELVGLQQDVMYMDRHDLWEGRERLRLKSKAFLEECWPQVV